MDFPHRKTFLFASLLALIASSVACTGGSGPNAPTEIPIPIEGLDGMSGVALNSSFTWSPDAEIDTSTVTTSTFFIVPTLASASSSSSVAKSNYNTTVCNASLALDAAVSCDSTTSCTLNPTDALEQSTVYTICLTADILYATGTAITPMVITFVSESDTFGVTLVLDGAGKPVLASGTTGVDPASFTIYLTNEPGNTEGFLTFWCDPHPATAPSEPSLEVTVLNSSITLSIEDAYQYQLLDCALTLRAGFPNVSGNTLGSDVSYSFVNDCAASDDFNADSQSCWTVQSEAVTWTSWDALLNGGILAFDALNSELDYANTLAGVTGAVLSKEVAVDPQGFEITLETNSLTNFDDTGTPSGPADSATVSMGSSGNLFGNEFLNVGFGYDFFDAPLCFICYTQDGGATIALAAGDCIRCATERCQIRLTVSDRQISGSYAIGGGVFQSMVMRQGAFPTDDDFTDLVSLSFGVIDNGADNRAAIDAIIVTGITVSRQY